MPKRGRSNHQKKKTFFDSVKNEKIDTLQWSLVHGGFTCTNPTDAKARSAIILACGLNCVDSVTCMIAHLKNTDRLEDLNNRHSISGMTPLMFAAANGNVDIVTALLDAGADTKLECGKGYTARTYAGKREEYDIVRLLDQRDPPGPDAEVFEEPIPEPEPEPEPEPVAAPEPSSASSSSSSPSSSSSSGGRQLIVKAAAPDPSKDEKKARVADEKKAAQEIESKLSELNLKSLEDVPLPDTAPEAVWEEVAEVFASRNDHDDGTCDIHIDIDDNDDSTFVDPCLWHCSQLNLLQMSAGLTACPPQLGHLSNMLTLILSNNALTSLPETIGNLSLLKYLEVNENKLTSFPSSIGLLSNLETLSAAHNQLADIKGLSPLRNLTIVKLDYNENLTSLEGLEFSRLKRLFTLSASHCKIHTLDDSVGDLKALETLDMSYNELKEIPFTLGNLQKKLKELHLLNNPIKDPKAKKNLQKADDGARGLKECLKFFAKNCKKGGKKKKKR